MVDVDTFGGDGKLGWILNTGVPIVNDHINAVTAFTAMSCGEDPFVVDDGATAHGTTAVCICQPGTIGDGTICVEVNLPDSISP